MEMGAYVGDTSIRFESLCTCIERDSKLKIVESIESGLESLESRKLWIGIGFNRWVGCGFLGKFIFLSIEILHK